MKDAIAIGQRDTDDPQSPRRLRQSQKRLTSEQTDRMCQKYRNGATVYELGREFGIDRHTVAVRLKKAGVKMRLQSPTSKEIDEMVKLHEFEDSVASIASRIGYSTNTV